MKQHRFGIPPSDPGASMNARLVWAPVAAMALAFGATLAVAQTSGDGASAARSGSKESRVASKAAASTNPLTRQAWERMHRASKIMGMDVVNRQGEKVGDIEDIVLDRNGSVAYAIVSTGGFLGVGDKLHAVPWRSLEANAGTGQFTLDVDKEKLGKAPGFDNNGFPDVNDPKWSAENRKHFPVASSAASRSATTGSESMPPSKKERDDTQSSSGRSPTGNDVGPTTSTSRRSGPAAGSGSSTAAPDAGSTSGTSAGSTMTSNSAPKPHLGTTGGASGGSATNPAGISRGAGNAPAPGGSSTPGTMR
ncbi:MAG: PRC-barrel domain-containing protein [Burkholderiaceae bacterium]